MDLKRAMKEDRKLKKKSVTSTKFMRCWHGEVRWRNKSSNTKKIEKGKANITGSINPQKRDTVNGSSFQ